MAGGVGGALVTARLTNIMAESVLTHCLITSLIFFCVEPLWTKAQARVFLARSGGVLQGSSWACWLGSWISAPIFGRGKGGEEIGMDFRWVGVVG